MTAEDPVEFQLPGINQVQMKESIGLNFAAALRSFLRQDPNIVLVGEIRDFETAEIAIKAALTGHLVLSTLHTNDAPSTINRLMNMGIEPFLVATSVNLICAQRLIRRICQNCKQEEDVPVQALLNIGFSEAEAPNIQLYKGRGCDACNGRGYKGRIGLYRGDGGHRRHPRADPVRRVGRRAAAQGARGRYDRIEAVGAAEDPRRGHHHRRGGPRNGPVGAGDEREIDGQPASTSS